MYLNEIKSCKESDTCLDFSLFGKIYIAKQTKKNKIRFHRNNSRKYNDRCVSCFITCCCLTSSPNLIIVWWWIFWCKLIWKINFLYWKLFIWFVLFQVRLCLRWWWTRSDFYAPLDFAMHRLKTHPIRHKYPWSSEGNIAPHHHAISIRLARLCPKDRLEKR